MPEPLTLMTSDGVRIDADHLQGPDAGLCVVLAHGFTCNRQQLHLRRIANVLNRVAGAGVLAIDFRGHGRSGGQSTVGDREVLDIEAAVDRARSLGYHRVAVVGFSMGAAVAVRHAALLGGIDAVVAVSGPARWYYRGTTNMRFVHWAIEKRVGRLWARLMRGTRIANAGWDPMPEAPYELAGRIAPVPLLVVHGTQDPFFPVDHAEQIYAAASEPRELWIEAGFGHAEVAVTRELVTRISGWVAARSQDIAA
jgi:pimeloyl-ACP methyl ester carboxylesterase